MKDNDSQLIYEAYLNEEIPPHKAGQPGDWAYDPFLEEAYKKIIIRDYTSAWRHNKENIARLMMMELNIEDDDREMMNNIIDFLERKHPEVQD